MPAKQPPVIHLIESYIDTISESERAAALSELILHFSDPASHIPKKHAEMAEDLKTAFTSTDKKTHNQLGKALSEVCIKYSALANKGIKPNSIYNDKASPLDIVSAFLLAEKEGKTTHLKLDMAKVAKLSDAQFHALCFAIKATKPEITLINFISDKSSLERDEAILGAISSKTTLHLDHLKSKMFTPANMAVLKKAIAKANALYLTYSELNKISTDDLKHIVTALEKNKALVYLNLSHNHLALGTSRDSKRAGLIERLMKLEASQIDLRANDFDRLPKENRSKFFATGKSAVEGREKTLRLGSKSFFGHKTDKPTTVPMDDLPPAGSAQTPALPPR